jgi:glycine/D-amino acid oxidase-like deaminating enzyme
MGAYDWIVVGAGITGSALSYELAKKGFKVLLLDPNPTLNNATRYSYGGLAYWSGTTELTRTLCEEGKTYHQTLSQELGVNTELRELDLILPFNSAIDPEILAQKYRYFATPPELITTQEACELEPLLNPNSIGGAFTVRHGQISPENLNNGYLQAFKRLGGNLVLDRVLQINSFPNQAVNILTNLGQYQAENIAICAGGYSRQLLKNAGISLPIYFTHTEILETPPVDLKLQTIVMSATMERFQLEAKATQPELQPLWEKPGHELTPFIIDKSAAQLLDGRIRIGQPSRTLSDVNATVNLAESETLIRQEIANILPGLANLPATCYHCLVAFSSDSLPLIGAIANFDKIHVFSGFSNPLVFIPPLAKRFADSIAGKPDPIITQLSPSRLISSIR